MHVGLPYGKSTLKLDLPEGVNAAAIRKPPLPALPDAAAAVREALDRPDRRAAAG